MTQSCQEAAQYWIKTFGGKFVTAETNKLDDEIAVILKDNTLYLVNQKYNSPVFAPKLYFSLEGTKIKIQDVLMRDINIGNGSIALKVLIKLAQYWGVKEIVGYMSDIDSGHKERRNYFYEKFGFQINGNWARLIVS